MAFRYFYSPPSQLDSRLSTRRWNVGLQLFVTIPLLDINPLESPFSLSHSIELF